MIEGQEEPIPTQVDLWLSQKHLHTFTHTDKHNKKVGGFG